MMEKEKLFEAVKAYCDKLTKHVREKYPDCKDDYTFTKGIKYIRVVCNHNDWTTGKNIQQSAFCFIDYEGNIYKTDSWERPAKGVRATLDNAPLDGARLYR